MIPALSCRAQDMTKTHLFQEVLPNCLCQGRLGDCWLLAAMSNIAEFPNLVYSCFPDQDDVNPEGNYSVRLFDPVDFQEHLVDIDDLLPMDRRMPVFARPMSNEIWVLLLEKACAKFLHKGYAGGNGEGWQSISCGCTLFAEVMFTGCQDNFLWCKEGEGWGKNKVTKFVCKSRFYVRKEKVMDNNGLFEALSAEDNGGSMMSACAAKPGDDTQSLDNGLVLGHAYSLLHIKETSAGRMAQLRNPWGNAHEWNGACSDASGFWETDEGQAVASEVGYVPAVGDGLFWMNWDDFCENIGRVYVTQTRSPRRESMM